MAQLSILAGATSVSINVFIQDSSSTIGAGLAAVATAGGTLLANTKAYYSFSGANAGSVSIALAVLAATSTGWTTAGIVTIDDTNMKGVNRIDIPNAALAASKGRSVTIYVYGGANMAPCVTTIELTGWDNQNGVSGGMTALPSAAANAAGGLPVSIAGALDLDEMNVDIEAIQTSTAGLTFTGAGKVDASVRDWVGDTIPARNVTGVPLIDVEYWDGVAIAEPATDGIPDVNVKNIVNVAAAVDANNYLKVDLQDILGTVVSATTPGIIDTNVLVWKNLTAPNMTGDAFARLGAPAGSSIAADLVEIEGETDTLLTSTAQTGDTYGLLTGANTELAAVPASTATLVQMIKYLYLLARNKILQTSTTTTVTANDGATTVGTSTISDDGVTFTRGPFA